MSITRAEALEKRANIEVAAKLLDDKQASLSAWMFPKLKYDGSLIEYQHRINWFGRVMMARTALWDTLENDPEHAPDMWAEIEYYKGYRKIKENMSAEEAFHLDECGWWENELWRSKYEGNVYTPATAPNQWEKVTE